MPEISVVMPLYNKEVSVRRAIQSVLEQDMPDFELIIVDDGSTDQSFAQACQFQDPRIRFIQQTNQGVSRARNVGVSASKSHYVAFIDADDRYHPNFLSSMKRMMTDYPQACFYCCRFEVIDETGRLMQTRSYLPDSFSGPVTDFFSLYKKDRLLLCPSSFMVNKAAFFTVGGFSEDAVIGEDICLWIALALNGQVVVNNKIASTMFRNAENRTAGKASQTVSKYAEIYLGSGEWRRHLQAKQIDSVLQLVGHYAFIQACVAVSHDQKPTAKRYAKLLSSEHKFSAVLIWLAILLVPSSLLRGVKLFRNRLIRVKPDAE